MTTAVQVQPDQGLNTMESVQAELAELKQRVEALEPGQQNKLSMIVFSGELDKLLASMIIATGAAAMGMKVVLFFTFWGTAALRKPDANVGGKDLMAMMFGWIRFQPITCFSF